MLKFRCVPCSCIALAVPFLLVHSAHPQETPTAVQPSDPRSLILEAIKSNNLTSGDLQPWHLKATFVVLDDQGKTTDQGTYEEFWAGPNKSKIDFSTPSISRTDFRTENGILRSGPPGYVPAIAAEARREFVEPLPAVGEKDRFDLESRDAGSTKLSCIKITLTVQPVNPGLQYCLATDTPMLRLSVLGFESLQVLRNRVVSFHGHYLPGDLQFIRAGKTIGTAHLETIESIDPVNEAIFAPSPDAKPLPKKIQISAGVAVGMLKKHPVPEYPPQAINSRISGLVVLQVTIGTDGRVIDLHVVNGPAVFQKAALDAVRNWEYKPYLLNGEPVEVTTTVNVVFSLDNPNVPIVKTVP